MTDYSYRSETDGDNWRGEARVRGLQTVSGPDFFGAPRQQGKAKASQRSLWLSAYTILLALTVWVLVFSGGLVTSKGVGLSVPDWPTTYGYNMFAFPISRWVGGVFYEHSHRVLASGVGFMTIILAFWLWLRDDRKWMRCLGLAAVFAVVLQGVLGGLRVVWLKDQIGIFHACLAQAFLTLVSFITLAASVWWSNLGRADITPEQKQSVRKMAWLVAGIAVLIYAQLALGAAMRHAHAGLSIRDFPTAYGHWWPATDGNSLLAINQDRVAIGLPKTTGGLILLQMFHRLGAFLVAIGVIVTTIAFARHRALLEPNLRRLGFAGWILITLQIFLGIYTIWTNKAADIATLHVATGAASLVWAMLTFSGLLRWSRAAIDTATPAVASSRALLEVVAGR